MPQLRNEYRTLTMTENSDFYSDKYFCGLTSGGGGEHLAVFSRIRLTVVPELADGVCRCSDKPRDLWEAKAYVILIFNTEQSTQHSDKKPKEEYPSSLL
jgi:hypothetical protein